MPHHPFSPLFYEVEKDGERNHEKYIISSARKYCLGFTYPERLVPRCASKDKRSVVMALQCTHLAEMHPLQLLRYELDT